MKVFIMEDLCLVQKITDFCQNFRYVFSYHHQWLMDKKRERVLIKGKRERERNINPELTEIEAREKPNQGLARPSPPHSQFFHMVHVSRELRTGSQMSVLR